MKKIALPVICVLALIACNNKITNNKSAKNEQIDIITLTDNGHTYADTITFEKGNGVIVPRNFTKPNADISVEGTGTEHFASSTDKKTANEEVINYGCSLRKTAKNSVLIFNCYLPCPSFPFALMIANAPGPLSGVGIYKAPGSGITSSKTTKRDTIQNLLDVRPISTFAETFTNSIPYTVDSAIVNIKKASGKTIEGNFQMWLTNAAGSKTVTGTIHSDNALID